VDWHRQLCRVHFWDEFGQRLAGKGLLVQRGRPWHHLCHHLWVYIRLPCPALCRRSSERWQLKIAVIHVQFVFYSIVDSCSRAETSRLIRNVLCRVPSPSLSFAVDLTRKIDAFQSKLIVEEHVKLISTFALRQTIRAKSKITKLNRSATESRLVSGERIRKIHHPHAHELG